MVPHILIYWPAPYQDELSGEAVVFAPVQVQERVVSFSCSELHQAAEATLLQPRGRDKSSFNHPSSFYATVLCGR